MIYASQATCLSATYTRLPAREALATTQELVSSEMSKSNFSTRIKDSNLRTIDRSKRPIISQH